MMRRRSTALFVFALITLSALGVRAQAARDRLTVEQFLDWEMVASPQVSPDGRQVVYTRRWTDKVNDRYEDELWIVDPDGGRNRFLTKGSQAAWSPDGRRLAYVAAGQPAGPQVFVRWMDAPGETQLTHLERAPSNLAWSPDGRSLAFTMLVPSTPTLTVRMPPRPNGARWVEPPRVIERLGYRSDGSGWRPVGFAHIFVVSSDGGTPRQLTEGDYQHGAPRWMPDSQTIVFSAVRKPDAEYLRNDSEVYSLAVRGGTLRQLTDRKGPDTNPSVSPDGRLIAYTGFDQTGDTYHVTRLYVMNADGTERRELTTSFDRSTASLHWAPDGSGIYFVSEDRGSQNLWLQPLRGGAPRQLTDGVQILSLASVSRTGLAAATRSSSHAPADVVVFEPGKPASARKLTAVNEDLLEGRRLGAVEEIWYDSVGGVRPAGCTATDSDPLKSRASDCAATRVQGWIVKPPDFDPAKKYPLILYIHGGPHTMYGVGFNFEFQNHAAEGYVVLYTNPRGSTGYGKAFGNAINNAYPGQDYDDLMRGVDELVKRGYIDERNLFVTGGSGGGVLTTWIVGHTDRFAAAVAMKPVVNWYSFVGTTDGPDWYHNFKKLPWEDPEEHLRRSPLTYVGRVKTPTMILTGDLDLRTPLEQTEQYYRALKMRRVPTAMVRLTDEYHGFNAEFGLRHPSNRISQILYLRGWFERHKRREPADSSQ